jgi:hypothetical protein
MYIWNSKARKVVYLTMQHITGIPRNQLFFSSLEDTILPENPVRFIDAFVEALALQTLGFSVQTSKGGRSPELQQQSVSKNLLIRLSQRNQERAGSGKGMF